MIPEVADFSDNIMGKNAAIEPIAAFARLSSAEPMRMGT
jgi:hypothetical protein